MMTNSCSWYEYVLLLASFFIFKYPLDLCAFRHLLTFVRLSVSFTYLTTYLFIVNSRSD